MAAVAGTTTAVASVPPSPLVYRLPSRPPVPPVLPMPMPRPACERSAEARRRGPWCGGAAAACGSPRPGQTPARPSPPPVRAFCFVCECEVSRVESIGAAQHTTPPTRKQQRSCAARQGRRVARSLRSRWKALSALACRGGRFRGPAFVWGVDLRGPWIHRSWIRRIRWLRPKSSPQSISVAWWCGLTCIARLGANDERDHRTDPPVFPSFRSTPAHTGRQAGRQDVARAGLQPGRGPAGDAQGRHQVLRGCVGVLGSGGIHRRRRPGLGPRFSLIPLPHHLFHGSLQAWTRR